MGDKEYFPLTPKPEKNIYILENNMTDKPLYTDKILFRGARVLDLNTEKSEELDIVVLDGKIDTIGKVESFSGETIDASGQLVVPGLIDMHVHLREPGREDEETVVSGCQAAMAGGVTAVCPMPNTDPACDKRQVVEYLKKQAGDLLVDVYPIAAITKGRKGEEITEMAELIDAGAVAFSDDGNPVVNSQVMRSALEYSGMYGVPIIDHCEDPYLAEGGAMNESFTSTKLGLPGIPNIAEEIMISRDLALAKFTGGRIHIAHISTAGSVELVRRAKAEGINVTCEVTPHHLVLTDEAVTSFDTNTKMNPPLRTVADVEALHQGLADGTIDAIASDHAPHSIEEKDVEFAAAPFGIIGLETLLGIVLTHIVLKDILSLADAIKKLSWEPARILSIEKPQIEKGAKANLTIFDPEATWIVDKYNLFSKSRNTPFDGWELNGKIFGVYNRGLWWKASYQ